MTTARDSAVGAALAGGYCIGEQLRGTAPLGMYRATAEGATRPMLVTVGAAQSRSYLDLAADLSMKARGVAPLRHIGPLGDSGLDVMMEEEPEGWPASELQTPLDPGAVSLLCDGIGHILTFAHAAGIVLRHLRPELIYVDGDVVTGVAPRAEEFLATAGPPGSDIEPMFDAMYQAPEILTSTGAPTAAADVFSLAALAVTWLSGRHPFAGDDLASQLDSTVAGRRRPWTAVPVLDRALAPAPAVRPRLAELVLGLRAL
jgi:hypothetical protein